MDHLWSPWRYRYVSTSGSDTGLPEGECLFCRISSESKDKDNYVLLRAERNYVLLNRFPYTSGHLMIVPYTHVRPRWVGDVNFMTTVAETRVLPEDLETTYTRLMEKLNSATKDQE